MRSRSAEGTAWSDAGPQAGSQRQGRDRRAWLRAKPATRALRTRGRGAGEPADGGRVRRTRLGDLILDWGMASACRAPTRRNRACKAPLVGVVARLDHLANLCVVN